MKIFHIDDAIKYNHQVGDTKCPECWSEYPCACECGGLIHAQFGDENYDGDYWLDRQCDKCGDDYREVV